MSHIITTTVDIEISDIIKEIDTTALIEELFSRPDSVAETVQYLGRNRLTPYLELEPTQNAPKSAA
jgi:hypothetical protein